MNSKKTVKTWSMALVELLENKTPAEQKKIIGRLASALKQKKAGYLLPRILDIAAKQRARRHRLWLTLASDQPKEAAERLAKKIAGYFGADFAAQVDINKDLIGGFVAKTENRLIDASVKNFLDQMKKGYES